MNHELNAQVAEEVMGWTHISRISHFGYPPSGPIGDNELGPPYWAGRIGAVRVPDYSGSLDAAWEMEKEIKRRLLLYPYVNALLRQADLFDCFPMGCSDCWDIIHATPGQRCRAALEAVKEK